jgi:hypothetical protein
MPAPVTPTLAPVSPALAPVTPTLDPVSSTPIGRERAQIAMVALTAEEMSIATWRTAVTTDCTDQVYRFGILFQKDFLGFQIVYNGGTLLHKKA